VVHVEHVRLDGVQVNAQAGEVVDARGKLLRAPVIVREPIDHLFEGHDACGGDDPGLPHAAADALAPRPGLFDEIRIADDQRSDRAAQSLGQAEHDRVRFGRIRRGGHAGRDGRVEDARAIEVHLQSALPRNGAEPRVQVERDHPSSAAVVSVLQAEDARDRIMNVSGSDRRRDFLGVQEAGSALDRLGHQPGDACEPAGLVVVDVRFLVDNHFVSGRTVRHQADEVPHRPADDEERGLLAQDPGGHLLEPVDRGVLPVDVVAERRVSHGVQHRFGRERQRVASEIQNGLCHVPAFPSVQPGMAKSKAPLRRWRAWKDCSLRPRQRARRRAIAIIPTPGLSGGARFPSP